MIGELIRDYFLRKKHPTLVRQAVQAHFANTRGKPNRGAVDVECPVCGHALVVTVVQQEWTPEPQGFWWFASVVCPGCGLESDGINTGVPH